eukprot:6312823-Prymnesium_polylepis.2
MIGLIEEKALVEALVLRDERSVALPEGWPQRRTPAHAPLGLVVAIVDGRVEDARLAVDGGHVAAPKVAVQHRRLDVDA